MKNILENVAVTTVVILFLFIIALIVRYNMIDDGSVVEDITQDLPVVKEESRKAKTTNYLQNLESYTDVDVKVDPTKVNTANTVQVTSELAKDEIVSAVEGTNKSGYVDSLENYADKADEEKEEEKTEDDKVKLDQDEIVDEIGDAIGAALED